MAEGSFGKMVFASIMVVLFAFISLSWMFGFIEDNGGDITKLQENGPFDYSEINNSLNDVQLEAERIKDVFTQSEDEGVLDTLTDVFSATTSFFTLPIQMIGFVIDLFDLVIVDGMAFLWGSSPVGAVITSVIIGMIIFGIIFGILRLMKQGD